MGPALTAAAANPRQAGRHRPLPTSGHRGDAGGAAAVATAGGAKAGECHTPGIQ